MIDSYNDSTGSRKKFLIPLVVLLLCAVSLTGAGYAYNSSVSIENGSGEVDEIFVIDLYTTAGAAITSNEQVNLGTGVAADGIVVTTVKGVGDASTITGKLVLEKDFDAVLFTGKFRVDADNLARDPATTTATVTSTPAKLVGAITMTGSYTLAPIELTSANLAVRFYDDAAAVAAGTQHDGSTFEVDTDYYFQIVLTSLPDNTITGGTGLEAVAWATGAADATLINFSFELNAEAIEEDA